MKLIDTHTHLFDEAFDDDRDEVIERALEAGIEKMLCPAIDSQSYGRLFELCNSRKGVCLSMMGLHPTHVNDNPQWKEELRQVEEHLAAPPVEKFYAVGEIGLDLYWSKEWLKEQEEAFRAQVELSLKYDLPIVVHTRSAWKEMVDVLRDYSSSGIRGVMHSFSGFEQDYRAVRECGDFLFGVGGVVTYKNSGLPEVLDAIPLEEIVLETDSPYLPPVPHRGKRNESAYLKLICGKVAEIKGVRGETAAEVTTENAVRMFGL